MHYRYASVRSEVKDPRKISEASVMQEVKAALSFLGWRVLRVPPSIYSDIGWCDLIAIRKGRVMFIECKRPACPKQKAGTLRKQQEIFKQMIEDAGGTYVLARCYADVETVLTEMKLNGQ